MPTDGGQGGRLDHHMARQSAFFGDTTLERTAELAGPRKTSSREDRNVENSQALGGMRRPDLAVASKPGYATVGRKLRAVLQEFLDMDTEGELVIERIRAGAKPDGFSPGLLSRLRAGLLQALGCSATPSSTGPQVELFRAWGLAVGDQDCAEFLPRWLVEGAPMGITRHVDLAGVFPRVEPGTPTDHRALRTEWLGWANYSSAEEEPGVVMDLLRAQRDKGHCVFFGDKEGMLEYLAVKDVVLSKLALITKFRPDGTRKDRLIWDLRRSEVNEAATLGERLVLPRLQDAVEDALAANRGCRVVGAGC